MRLPSESASYLRRVSFGSYCARRLKRAKLNTLAQDVQDITQDVKEKGRAWDDAQEPIQNALADRDAADDNLDQNAQEIRLKLSSRSITAVREAPYTNIFPKGIEYYTAAPLDKEVQRYEELIQRLETHLPADDPVRVEFVPKIREGIAEFEAAEKAVSSARNDLALANTALQEAEDKWRRQMEKTYGALVTLFNRKTAERFFPRSSARRSQGKTSSS